MPMIMGAMMHENLLDDFTFQRGGLLDITLAYENSDVPVYLLFCSGPEQQNWSNRYSSVSSSCHNVDHIDCELVVKFSGRNMSISHTVETSDEYHTTFLLCGEETVLGRIYYRMLNANGSELSAGTEILPVIYVIFALVWLTYTAFYVIVSVRMRDMILKHRLLLGLLLSMIFKTASLCLYAILWYSCEAFGQCGNAQNAGYVVALLLNMAFFFFYYLTLVGCSRGCGYVHEGVTAQDRRVFMLVTLFSLAQGIFLAFGGLAVLFMLFAQLGMAVVMVGGALSGQRMLLRDFELEHKNRNQNQQRPLTLVGNRSVALEDVVRHSASSASNEESYEEGSLGRLAPFSSIPMGEEGTEVPLSGIQGTQGSSGVSDAAVGGVEITMDIPEVILPESNIRMDAEQLLVRRLRALALTRNIGLAYLVLKTVVYGFWMFLPISVAVFCGEAIEAGFFLLWIVIYRPRVDGFFLPAYAICSTAAAAGGEESGGIEHPSPRAPLRPTFHPSFPPLLSFAQPTRASSPSAHTSSCSSPNGLSGLLDSMPLLRPDWASLTPAASVSSVSAMYHQHPFEREREVCALFVVQMPADDQVCMMAVPDRLNEEHGK